MTSSAARALASLVAVLALTAALLVPATSASAWHWNDCRDAPANLPPGSDTTCPLVPLSPTTVMSASLELTMHDDLSFDNATVGQHTVYTGASPDLSFKGPSSGTGGVWRMENATLGEFTADFRVSARIIDSGTPTAIWLRAELYWSAHPSGLGWWRSSCELYDGNPFGGGRRLPVNIDWGTHEDTPFDCVTHNDSGAPYAKTHITVPISLASLNWGSVHATLATAGDVTLTSGTVQSPIARFLVDGTKTPASTAVAAHDVTTTAPLTFEAFRRNAEPPGNAQGTAIYQITDGGFPTPYWVRAWAQNYKWLSFYYSDETCEVFRGDPRAGGTVDADAPYSCVQADVSGRKSTEWRFTWTVSAVASQPVALLTSGWIASQCGSADTVCVFLPHDLQSHLEPAAPISPRLWNTTATAATRGVTYDSQRAGSASLPLAARTERPALTAAIDSVAQLWGERLFATVRDRGMAAVTAAPHSVGWLEASAPFATITGDYLVRYDDDWYRVSGVTVTLARASGPLTVTCAPIAEYAGSGSGCAGAVMSIASKAPTDIVISGFGGARPLPAPTPAPVTPAPVTPAPLTPAAPALLDDERLAETGGTVTGPGLVPMGILAVCVGLGILLVARRRVSR